MALLPTLFVFWGIVMTCMIALVVFNLAFCRCNQDPSQPNYQSDCEKQKREKILRRARLLNPYVRSFGTISALMTLGLAGIASWAAVEKLIQ